MKKFVAPLVIFVLFVAILLVVAILQLRKDLSPEDSSANANSVEARVDKMLQGAQYDASTVLVKYKDSETLTPFTKTTKNGTKRKIKLNFSLESVRGNETKVRSRTITLPNGEKRVVDLPEMVAKVATSNLEKSNVRVKLIELLKDPRVEYAEPNYIMETSAWSNNGTVATPGDYNATKHWYYDKGKVRQMWADQNCGAGAKCGGSENVTVAVIDTGLAFESYNDSGSPYSFAEYWLGITGGKNYTAVSADYSGANFNINVNSGETPANGKDDDCNGVIDDYNGIDVFSFRVYMQYMSSSYPTCNNGVPYDYSGSEWLDFRRQGHPVDTHGHGSFVTGNVAGVVDNAGDTISPAHNVTIMPIAANFHHIGSFSSSDILTALSYADFMGADVINLSLGGAPYSQFADDMYKDLHENGVVVVSATGNDSTSTNLVPVQYPAAYETVIAVGAADKLDVRANYSNGSSELDLVAYTGHGTSTANSSIQQTLSCTWSCNDASTYNGVVSKYGVGTSFASPQVAAAAAIILSNNPGMEPDLVKLGLVSSTIDLDDPGYDTDTGWGALSFELANQFSFDSMDLSYYPAYRYQQDGTRKAWVNAVNPSTTEASHVAVKINGVVQGQYDLNPGEVFHKDFKFEVGGPVEVFSNTPIFTTLETEIFGEPNEFAGISENALSTKVYYPAYRHNGGNRKAWIVVGNPSMTTTANVQVKMAGQVKGTFAIAPGARISESFNFVGGPVEVSSDIPIYSTQKYLVEESGNEMAGITPDQLGNKFYYPAYRDDGGKRKAWIIVGNPSTDTNANVEIFVGGQSKGTYNLAPGERISQDYPGETGEVAEVVSDISVYTTLKINVLGYPNEMPGIKADTIGANYFYPRYVDNGSSKFGWINVANPSPTLTANVEVLLGGSSVGNYVLEPGGRISESYNFTGGPVEIVSDQNVYTTYKVRVNNSPNEYPGIGN